MFYRIIFWAGFILITILSAFLFLMNGYANNFLKLILMSFACGFLLSFVLSGLLRFVVHAVQWLDNLNDYRLRFQERNKV